VRDADSWPFYVFIGLVYVVPFAAIGLTSATAHIIHRGLSGSPLRAVFASVSLLGALLSAALVAANAAWALWGQYVPRAGGISPFWAGAVRGGLFRHISLSLASTLVLALVAGLVLKKYLAGRSELMLQLAALLFMGAVSLGLLACAGYAAAALDWIALA